MLLDPDDPEIRTALAAAVAKEAKRLPPEPMTRENWSKPLNETLGGGGLPLLAAEWEREHRQGSSSA